ncbi:hypothetical protein CEUSTIGMA_g13555.t1 [Chlamydomonas eustigma]|uniref:Uncharacterized protein n=1 Tax=Chlamydomonas eustigma TaxID=1157962 RepID=A0A250XT95_9CHLO|nr:hypothetical protein CEUSTIGMA_g13555.t1 [Chlamydomonas eustigma]|eukprot:GAX86142.1 hypothetical protein CEUSTIGMA_g13555.t1 [Chlamydomonas eustigma]
MVFTQMGDWFMGHIQPNLSQLNASLDDLKCKVVLSFHESDSFKGAVELRDNNLLVTSEESKQLRVFKDLADKLRECADRGDMVIKLQRANRKETEVTEGVKLLSGQFKSWLCRESVDSSFLADLEEIPLTDFKDALLCVLRDYETAARPMQGFNTATHFEKQMGNISGQTCPYAPTVIGEGNVLILGPLQPEEEDFANLLSGLKVDGLPVYEPSTILNDGGGTLGILTWEQLQATLPGQCWVSGEIIINHSLEQLRESSTVATYMFDASFLNTLTGVDKQFFFFEDAKRCWIDDAKGPQKEKRKRDVHATTKSVQKFVGLLDKTVGKRWKKCIVEKRPLQGNSYAYCLSHDVPLEFDEEDVSRVRKKLVYILATGQRF